MKALHFSMLGAGFWAQYHLAAWRELNGARCVAVYNRTRGQAEALAQKFNVPAVYDDAEEMFRRERLDFVDILTAVDTHHRFVLCGSKERKTMNFLLRGCERFNVPVLAVLSACRTFRRHRQTSKTLADALSKEAATLLRACLKNRFC